MKQNCFKNGHEQILSAENQKVVITIQRCICWEPEGGYCHNWLFTTWKRPSGSQWISLNSDNALLALSWRYTAYKLQFKDLHLIFKPMIMHACCKCNKCVHKVCIPDVPKKAELLIISTLWANSVIIFTSLNKTSSAEENDTKIIEFGWVILILCQLLETRSFSNFAWFLWPMSIELYRERPFI